MTFSIVSIVTIAIVGWRMYCLQLCLAYRIAPRRARRGAHVALIAGRHSLQYASVSHLLQCSQHAAIWHKLQLALLRVENFRHGKSLWHEDVGQAAAWREDGVESHQGNASNYKASLKRMSPNISIKQIPNIHRTYNSNI